MSGSPKYHMYRRFSDCATLRAGENDIKLSGRSGLPFHRASGHPVGFDGHRSPVGNAAGRIRLQTPTWRNRALPGNGYISTMTLQNAALASVAVMRKTTGPSIGCCNGD
jgi:hypothetical protein